ncbi:hypothetical protein Tco_0826546 [Tanacetum coccineum]
MPPKGNATTTPTIHMTDAQIKALIARGVADALAERDADRSRNGDDSYDSGGDGRRRMLVAHECTYTDFLKCQPLNFKGTKGVFGNALTRWNSHVRTVGHDVAYAMPWKTLKKIMTDKYCPRDKIKKLEIEMWNLKVKGTDVLSYNKRFQELALMCGRMFPKESDEFATEPMDQKIHTIAERQAEIKRKFDDNNQTQQQPTKKQNVARACSVRFSEKEYAGTLPLCNKCKFHHNSWCIAKCANCKRVSHLTQDCQSPAATNSQRTLTCYECGNQGHYRSDCPKLKNRNHENQVGSTEARGMVYALGRGENDQDLDNMEDDINA